MTERTTAPARPRPAEEPHPSGDDRFNLIDKHLRRVQYGQDQLIETLHLAQDVFGYLDDGILLYLATALRLPPSMVYGVATFYHLFTFDPPGDHSCTVCTGTARCIGSCGLAPVMVLDGEVLAHQSPESALEVVGTAVASGGEA